MPLAPPTVRPDGRLGWREMLAATLFWVLVGALALVRRALVPDPPFSLHTIAVTAVEYGPWVLLTPAVFAFAWRLPPERGRWAGRLLIHLVVAVLVAGGMGLVQSTAIRALGPPAGMTRGNTVAPMDALPVARVAPPNASPNAGPPPQAAPPDAGPPQAGPPQAGPRRGGPPLFQLSYQFVIYLIVLAVGLARAYALQLRERQGEAVRLAAEAARLDAERERLTDRLAAAQLAALRMQLNPHFLFNALNAVSALAEDDPEGVRHVVARLSALLRHVLDTDPTQEVPLVEELAFLRDYLDIQRVRFEDRLDVVEDIGTSALHALVPNLLLQPLVENAIEHGASRVRGGPGRVEIHARCVVGPEGEDRLVVTIRDNGPGLTASGPGGDGVGNDYVRPSGIGLANTRARLETLYGPDASLTLRPAEGSGVEAVVVIPYRPAGHPAHA
ncbi:MAG TPA: histidine kinase [Rhodothermales bacterium]|nr:histidine kinase [Rhodothermales bacterium]